MLKHAKKLILTISVVLITMILGTMCYQVAAYTQNDLSSQLTSGNGNLNKKFTINQLSSVPSLYCVLRTTDVAIGKEYKVTNYIKIDGKQATSIRGNNTTYGPITHNNNAIIAYILGKVDSSLPTGETDSNDNMTTRQKALWAKWNAWKQSSGTLSNGSTANVGSTLGITWENAVGPVTVGGVTYYSLTAGPYTKHELTNKLISEAETYATSTIKSISNSGSAKFETSGAVSGPFKVSYTGKISSVTVKNVDNSTVSKGTSGIQYYSDAQCKNEITDVTKIKSGSPFYIKNNTNKGLSKVTVTLEAYTKIGAEIWNLEGPSSGQKLAYVKTTTTSHAPSVTIEAKPETITITKTDADSTSTKLNGAKFVIWRRGKGWLGYNTSTKKVTYDNKWSGAYQFVTGQSYCGNTATAGVIKLTGLVPGYTYYIFETATPSSAYPLDKQGGVAGWHTTSGDWSTFDSTSDGKIAIPNDYCIGGKTGCKNYENVLIQNANNLGTKNTNYYSGTSINLTVKNKKYDSSITITKQDEDTKQKLNGAQFVIWRIGEGWLGYNTSTKKVTYDNKWSNDNSGAYKFETGKSYCGNTAQAGVIKLTGIKDTGKYYIFEVKTPSNDYPLNKQPGVYDSTGEWGTFGTNSLKNYITKNGYSYTAPNDYNMKNNNNGVPNVIINPKTESGYQTYPLDSNKNISITVENKAYNQSLEIKKVDADDNTKLINGAQFVIWDRGKGWIVPNDAGTAVTYDNIWSEAKKRPFVTGNKYLGNEPTTGVIKLTGLRSGGEYYIFEIGTGSDEYDLSEQDDYKPDGNSWSTFGTNEIKEYATKMGHTAPDDYRLNVGNILINKRDNDGNVYTGKDIKTTVTNRKKFIDIEGFVWEDKKIGKLEKNSVYDATADGGNGETRIPGVKVYLKQRSETDKTKYIQTTTTAQDGSYKLEEIDRTKLSDYYIEFDYSNYYKDNKRYIPVIFNVDKNNPSVTSKAVTDENDYPVKDSELKGKSTTYAGKPANGEDKVGLTYFLNLKDTNGNYLLYDSATSTLKNINLGISEVESAEYDIKQGVAYAKIMYNGQKFKYYYEGTGQQISEDYPTVNWGGQRAYSRAIYPSEIHGLLDGGDLKVYVVYRITVTNTEKKNSEIYKEDLLHITSLTESIDNIYELNKDIENDFDNEAKDDIAKWEGNSDGKNAKYNGTFTLGSEQSRVVYIQFKLKESRIREILNGNLGTSSDTPVNATAVGYHTYKRTDHGWFNSDSKFDVYMKEKNHQTDDDTRNAAARGMVFKLPDNQRERTVSGIVFKDKNTKNNGEIIGNGILDDSEEKIKDVEVQLYEKDGTTVAKRYPKNKGGNAETDPIKTAQGGTYSFEGVTPGEYIIRFKYSDGTVVDGNPIDVNNYKSTIVALNSAKSALGNGTNNHGGQWYKYQTGTENNAIDNKKYSVAVDNIETRGYADTNGKKSNDANTPQTTITIENALSNEGSANIQEPSFGGFNFGIIEEPDQKAEVEKVITHMQLTNSQGNVIFTGNPKSGNLQGVTDLSPENTLGSKKAKIEINEDSIYDSILELTYDIVVNNTSDINYIEFDKNHKGYYYYFGETGSYSRKVKLNIEEMLDTLDPQLTEPQLVYVSIDPESTKVTEDNKKQKLTIEGFGELSQGTSKKISIKAQVRLTRQDDLEFVNKIEITKLQNSIERQPGDPDLSSSEYEETLKLIKQPTLPDPSEAVATVVPPTGEDRVTTEIYAIAGVSALVMLATGVILIKKKVLN